MIVSLPSLLLLLLFDADIALLTLFLLLSPLDGADADCFIVMVVAEDLVEIGGRTAFRSISYALPKQIDF